MIFSIFKLSIFNFVVFLSCVFFSNLMLLFFFVFWAFQTFAAESGKTKYTAVTGDGALRQAISDDLFKRKGTKYSPEQIVVRTLRSCVAFILLITAVFLLFFL